MGFPKCPGSLCTKMWPGCAGREFRHHQAQRGATCKARKEYQYLTRDWASLPPEMACVEPGASGSTQLTWGVWVNLAYKIQAGRKERLCSVTHIRMPWMWTCQWLFTLPSGVNVERDMLKVVKWADHISWRKKPELKTVEGWDSICEKPHRPCPALTCPWASIVALADDLKGLFSNSFGHCVLHTVPS